MKPVSVEENLYELQKNLKITQLAEKGFWMSRKDFETCSGERKSLQVTKKCKGQAIGSVVEWLRAP